MSEGQLIRLWATLWPARQRTELADRIEQLTVDLLKLQLDVRELEQNIVEADVEELRTRFGQRAPRHPDLPS